MSDYNYDKFSSSEYALSDFSAPAPGDKAPDFVLQNVDGTRQNLLDFEGEFLILEIGSITCPLFQSRRKSMASLAEKLPENQFSILYVREAHPGDTRPQHKSDADKHKNALALKEQDGEGRTILVDEFGGAAHAAYGHFPNAVFIINRNGCVLFRSDWNNPSATGRALAKLSHGKSATGMGMFLPPKPPIAIKTLRDAGPGAVKDFLKSLPVLIWKNLLLRNFRVLTGKNPKILPGAQC
ncbi:MAG: redoxin domain-containing protein [Rhodobacteraceae bacterium]|nr:redoxin domain-containing protein [Paracoccaceae bacterium]